MEWGNDGEDSDVNSGYARIRVVNRALMETWFREISLVDIIPCQIMEVFYSPHGTLVV